MVAKKVCLHDLFIPDCGEHVRQMGAGPLYAVSVIDPSLSGLRVTVESVKVVVKVHVSRTQVSEQTRLKGETQLNAC